MEKETNEVFHVLGAEYALPYAEGMGQTKMKVLMAATILFAKKGFFAVSMRDIADATQIKAASLYNHFSGKEELLDAVLAHAKDLYLLYFHNLDSKIKSATSYTQVLDILFAEPEKMDNNFTNYAFALVQAEQFISERAADIYMNVFLKYSIQFIKTHLDNCVRKGWVAPFSTEAVASVFIHTVLHSINLQMQIYLGRAVPKMPGQVVMDLHQYILEMHPPLAP